MPHSIEMPDSAPDRTAMDGLLSAYYANIFDRMAALGGPRLDPAGPIADFWTHIDDFLPPAGCLCLARDQQGLVGCGTLSRLPGHRGELKRLFVHDRARGTGLGRALVETRIAQAHRMGLSALFVDTLANTHEMQGLYASLGFREIDRYPESATANAFPQMRPYMRYFTLDLHPDTTRPQPGPT